MGSEAWFRALPPLPEGWDKPIIQWARRKPRSRVRQRVWDATDRIDWRFRLLPLRRRLHSSGASSSQGQERGDG